MLQLNSVSWLRSTTQNPMLWLPQSNSQSSQDSSAFNSISNSKTSNTKKKKKLSVQCQYYDQQQKSFTSSSRPSSSSAPPVGESPPKVFVSHSIYKGKAALTIEPRAPEFSPLESGAYKLVKEGFALSQFAPASSARQYDWTRKQEFSLRVTEIGHVVGIFIVGDRNWTSCVQNKALNIDESIYIPVTRAEYTVLISAFNYILPYLLGWHAYANANSIKSADSSRENNVNPSYGGDYDWNRERRVSLQIFFFISTFAVELSRGEEIYYFWHKMTTGNEQFRFPLQTRPQQPGKEYLMHPLPQAKNPKYQPSNKLHHLNVSDQVAMHCDMLQGKVALVTGEGIEDRDKDETLKKLLKAKSNGAKEPIAIATDVKFEENCKKVVDQVVSEFGQIDILVNNAAE
ncbi:hypothetical protein H0E87_018857 [Populus deltoides]|uniref:Uncharacterized protein n=1 Tax=Populus deltoides TaxID=3696 RepID=A0A8T2XTK9_POPDE|nr:hypothetical protein H0E87_018857 [Populus deltoides]